MKAWQQVPRTEKFVAEKVARADSLLLSAEKTIRWAVQLVRSSARRTARFPLSWLAQAEGQLDAIEKNRAAAGKGESKRSARKHEHTTIFAARDAELLKAAEEAALNAIKSRLPDNFVLPVIPEGGHLARHDAELKQDLKDQLGWMEQSEVEAFVSKAEEKAIREFAHALSQGVVDVNAWATQRLKRSAAAGKGESNGKRQD